MAGILTPVSIPPPPPLLPFPQTTSAAPCPFPPSSRGSAPPSPRPPPTKPLPPHLPSAQLATPSPIFPASPFSASSCSFPSNSTSLSRSRPTATPSTSEFPPPSPPPNAPPPAPPPPPFPPSLISPSTLPPAANSPSCRPRVGMDPHQTIRHQHPPLSFPYPSPGTRPAPAGRAAYAGPRRAPAFVWFRVGSRDATPFAHRSDGCLLECLALRRDPDSSAVGRRFLCRDWGGGQYVPPPTLAYPPPPPRPVEAKLRTGLAPVPQAFLICPLPHLPLGNLSPVVFPATPSINHTGIELRRHACRRLPPVPPPA